MIGRLVNNGLESIWKEVVITKFEVLSWNLHGGTEKTHVKCQERWSLGLDLNRNVMSQLASYEGISNEISRSMIKCLYCLLLK
jgi:hypothetical protein